MSSKINAIQEKIANLKERQSDIENQKQTVANEIAQAEKALAAAIEEQKAEEARLTEQQRQDRRRLKELAAARLELAGKIDGGIKKLMADAQTLFNLGAEVEELARATGQFNPSLTLDKVKTDFADSIRESAYPLEIPGFSKHTPADRRKGFWAKEQSRLQALE
ncbi:MAG: hypothetical protein A4E55_00769 [Pelotomaculum sp. PtaU1.Bin035]|nr:MAG: hypothetical protein A4E55_00769 [Pelotomaculum sp. PtaU1.Bin035]